MRYEKKEEDLQGLQILFLFWGEIERRSFGKASLQRAVSFC